VNLAKGGLLRRRTCWLPTWRGGLLFVLILSLAGLGFVRTIHGFLALSDPMPAEILVVEGWCSDDALQRAAEEFRAGNYRILVTTGIPLDHGNFLVAYTNYAYLARATLIKLGVEPAQIQPVPAAKVIRNRTYESAVAFKRWLESSDKALAGVNLVTGGTHSRRSRFVYERVLGRRIGVISVPEANYDPERWWASSQGVKSVIEEIIGCLYSWIRY